MIGAVETKAQAASADTFKHRMEQLDDLKEVSMCACAWLCVCVLYMPCVYMSVLGCLHVMGVHVMCVHVMCVHVQGSVREMLTVNQKEYVAKIDQLNRSLERAWEKEQKVKALKIAIQVPCTRAVHGVV